MLRKTLPDRFVYLRKSQEEAGAGPSVNADQHGQPGGDIPESRAMGYGGRAGDGGDEAEQDEAGDRPS